MKIKNQTVSAIFDVEFEKWDVVDERDVEEKVKTNGTTNNHMKEWSHEKEDWTQALHKDGNVSAAVKKGEETWNHEHYRWIHPEKVSQYVEAKLKKKGKNSYQSFSLATGGLLIIVFISLITSPMSTQKWFQSIQVTSSIEVLLAGGMACITVLLVLLAPFMRDWMQLKR
eukprot:g587.t1